LPPALSAILAASALLVFSQVTAIVNCFFLIFDVIFNIANGVQHDGRLPFWKPASVFAHYVRIVIVFAIGEINILLTNAQIIIQEVCRIKQRHITDKCNEVICFVVIYARILLNFMNKHIS